MSTLVGRDDEQAAVERAVASVRAGFGGVLVLRGEPGVGKTALLQHAVEQATGYRILRLVGVEAERDLGFAALHQLLVPFLDELDAIPARQRDALRFAFGLAEGVAPDRLLVGLGALTLLATVATRQPLLCVVDDAQWLDGESARALAFVARRLYADQVAIVFAVRDEAENVDAFDGLPDVHVRGLADDAAAHLLRASVAGRVDDDVLRHIVTETRGNPLAIVELGTTLTPGELAGTTVLPEPLPLGPGLEERFLRQVRELPPEVRTMLLLVAAEASGDPVLVGRAAAHLGVTDDALAGAESARLLALGPPLQFRHPVIRSAVYHGASTSERRQVHEALAAVSDRPGEEHRRAWHRAAAAHGPDEDIAQALEEAAARARRRGGDVAVTAFLMRAVEMTPDTGTRAGRLVAAADADLAGGAPARALAKLEVALPDLDDDESRARAMRLQGASRLALGETTETLSILTGAGRALAASDPRLARETLLDALSVGVFNGRRASADAFEAIAKEAATIRPASASEPTAGDLLLDALATLYTRGLEPAAPHLRRAVSTLGAEPDEQPELLRWLGFGSLAAGSLGDYETVHALSTRLVTLSRAQGAPVALTRGLYFLALAEIVRGALDVAADLFTEGREIRAARGDRAGLGGVVVLAWRGQEAEARAEAAAVTTQSIERRQQGVEVYAAHGLCVLDLSLRRYAPALEHAQDVDTEDSFFLSTLALPDLVEAAVYHGTPEVAHDALRRLHERANLSGTPFALGMLARTRALLAPGDEAEALFVAAIEHLQVGTARGHLGRAHLLFGEWLRRRKRRRDAREHLRTAGELFDAIGARAFAERAHTELAATGERARRRSVETILDLTAQEEHVARFAAAGATNAEIAAQLFISPSTVDYHLRKVFRKLGVTSRRQLGEALAASV